MADIMKIKLPDVDTPYDVNDSTARTAILYGGAQQLLPIQTTYKSENGLTFSFSSGVLTVNGTATDDTTFTFSTGLTYNGLPNGKYFYLTGCPSGGGQETFCLGCVYRSGMRYSYVYDYGEGASFGFANNADFFVTVKNGVQMSQVKFYPMVSYTPELGFNANYTMTNAELTKYLATESGTTDTTVADNDLIPFYDYSDKKAKKITVQNLMSKALTKAENNLLGAKNFLPIQTTDGSSNGLTWTVNSDGSLIIDGTSTDSVEIPIFNGDYPIHYLFNDVKLQLVAQSEVSDITGWSLKFDINGYDPENPEVTVVYPYDYSFWIYQGGTLYTSNISGITDTSTAVFYDKMLNTKLVIPSGKTLDNEKITLMYTLQIDTDYTYAPYALTNKQITDMLEEGVASAISDLTDVSLTSLSDNDVLVYDDDNDVWVNEGGHLKSVTLTKEQYDALPSAQKNDPHIEYFVTDVTPLTGTIDDTVTTLTDTWSSSKIDSEITSRINAGINTVLQTSF